MSKTKEFLELLENRNLHFRDGEFEVVGKYINNRVKILCKNKYGECLVAPRGLLQNYNLCISSAINKTQYFINQAREIHGDRYDYSEVEYISSKLKISITCSEHGNFEQLPESHLRGRGCPICNKELNKFNLSDWAKMCPGNPGIFYVLRCWNETEEFFKVGITCDSVKNRYMNNYMPYKFEIVEEVINEDRKKIWDLEKCYKKGLREYRYSPNIPFGGQTECYYKVNTISCQG